MPKTKNTRLPAGRQALQMRASGANTRSLVPREDTRGGGVLVEMRLRVIVHQPN